MTPAAVNSVGLLLDIVGVLLLFRFGLPSDVGDAPDQGNRMMWGGPSPDERLQREERWTRYRAGSRSGLVLLVVGFVLQIASNHMLSPLFAPMSVALGVTVAAVAGGTRLWGVVRRLFDADESRERGS